MSRLLTPEQKAKLADCSCSLPAGRQHPRLSKKMVIVPFVIFSLALYLFWALWPPSAVWLLGIYGTIVIGTFIFRLIRGHTLWCAIRWSPVAALYIIADGIATGFSTP